jgi:thiamine biosynthesis lipoprotein
VRRVEDVMGMPVTVDVATGSAGRAVDEVFAEFRRLDSMFSTFKADSEVNRINAGVLTLDGADPLVRQAADLCRRYEQATVGYFNGWLGGRFDPTGVVKAMAIDRSCSILESHKLVNYLVDAGGDCFARGLNESRESWRVGIRHPAEREKVACVVRASDLAVATSGTYEKGDHIVDPHTGLPARELLSMTVVGPDILDSDVFATAAFAMGLEKGLAFIAGRRGYEAFAIDRSLVGHWTPGFDALRSA